MIKELAKYGRGYETPNGLQENDYYEMMYDLMEYVNKKGLTTRQAQKLFTDCADMVLDTSINPNTSNYEQTTKSDMDRLINELSNIGRTLEYYRLYH